MCYSTALIAQHGAGLMNQCRLTMTLDLRIAPEQFPALLTRPASKTRLAGTLTGQLRRAQTHEKKGLVCDSVDI